MINELKTLVKDNWASFGCGGTSDNVEFFFQAKQHAVNKFFMLVFNDSGTPLLIIKVFKDLIDANFFTNEYNNLRIAENILKDRKFSITIPKGVYVGKVAGKPFYIETFCKGSPFMNLFRSRNTSFYFETAVNWITRFHKLSQKEGKFELRDQINKFDGWYKKNEELFAQYFTRERFRIFLEKIVFPEVKKICNVFSHRDYTHYNMLIDEKNISILDWEYSEINGAPLEDILTFIMFYNSDFFNCTLLDGLKISFLKSGRASLRATGIIRKYMEVMEIDGCNFKFLLLNMMRNFVNIKISRSSGNNSKEFMLEFLASIVNKEANLISP